MGEASRILFPLLIVYWEILVAKMESIGSSKTKIRVMESTE